MKFLVVSAAPKNAPARREAAHVLQDPSRRTHEAVFGILILLGLFFFPSCSVGVIDNSNHTYTD